MKNTILIIATLFTFGLTSCETYDGDGIVSREVRTISNFDEITLPINAELVITQSSKTTLEIEAEGNILRILRSEVRNGKLRFSFDENWVKTSKKIKIWVSTPNISKIYSSGSGKIISDNKLIVDNLLVSQTGSGVIDIAADVKRDLDIDLNSSGIIYLEGITRNLEVDISGSGQVQAFNLDADNSDISMTGSGDCETTTYNNLDVRISGSGSVYFKGNPIVSKSISGSGSLIRL